MQVKEIDKNNYEINIGSQYSRLGVTVLIKKKGSLWRATFMVGNTDVQYIEGGPYDLKTFLAEDIKVNLENLLKRLLEEINNMKIELNKFLLENK